MENLKFITIIFCLSVITGVFAQNNVRQTAFRKATNTRKMPIITAAIKEVKSVYDANDYSAISAWGGCFI